MGIDKIKFLQIYEIWTKAQGILYYMTYLATI